MTQTQVVERAGVLLQVEFDPTPPVLFNSIRVLDENYRPCGPNLIPLLDPMFVLLDEQPGEETQTAEKLLSTFINEVT